MYAESCKDPKDALYRYVEQEDKIHIKDLMKQLVGVPPTNFLGKINHNLSYHEGKASLPIFQKLVYILLL